MYFYGATHVGVRRTENQDRFAVTQLENGCTLCTVCDGMGGASGGSIASELCLTTFVDYIRNRFTADPSGWKILLNEALNEANAAVYRKAADNESLRGMGTTLVAVLVDQSGNGFAVNVGDSRLYEWESGKGHQITHDHSYVQYLVDIGQITIKEAETSPIKNIITRSVGTEEKTLPDFFSIQNNSSKVFLLCSDGLTNYVKRDIIGTVLSDSTPSLLSEKAEKLIALANEGGGGDNITLILGCREAPTE